MPPALAADDRGRTISDRAPTELRRDAVFATWLRRHMPKLTTQARQKASGHLGKGELPRLVTRLPGFLHPTETGAVCGLPGVAELGSMLSSEN